MQSLRPYPKMPNNLPKVYEDNPNVSEDLPIIFGTRSSSLLKIGESSMKNCHLRALFNLLSLRVHYTLTYYIFARFLSDMAATTHTFQLGVRN